MPIFPSEPESTLDMITNFDIRASCILAFWAALPRRHFSIRVTYIIPHGELAYLFPLMNWGEFYFDLHLLFLDMGVYCKTILLGTSINFEFGSSRDCFFSCLYPPSLVQGSGNGVILDYLWKLFHRTGESAAYLLLIS
jgi:hypothetical protein